MHHARQSGGSPRHQRGEMVGLQPINWHYPLFMKARLSLLWPVSTSETLCPECTPWTWGSKQAVIIKKTLCFPLMTYTEANALYWKFINKNIIWTSPNKWSHWLYCALHFLPPGWQTIGSLHFPRLAASLLWVQSDWIPDGRRHHKDYRVK